MSVPPHVLIVGGGLAGIAAAAALTTREVRVTLLESRPRLGGRASSFTDQTTGETIDNCQHVSLGCCTNLQHLCASAGAGDLFRSARELFFIAADGRVNGLRAATLPAPLHLLPSFARLSYLSWADKRGLAFGLRALARARPAADDPEPFAAWLLRHRQTSTAIERFWHVVLVSALSESLDRISVAAARKVFVDGFLANRRGWEMLVPTVPLDELYTRRLGQWLTEQGVTLRLKAGVETLDCTDAAVRGVILRNGERLAADHVVLAVPQHLVEDLLPSGMLERLGIAGLRELETAPISSVHLWFDRQITDLPHAVLIDRLSQWMFNRGRAKSHRVEGQPPRAGYYYQVVISASRHLESWPQAEVIDEVRQELLEIWPAAGDAQLLHSRLVTEHKAVFSVLPGSDALRPQQQTAWPTLHLAGDWTRTGWPGTMEGAVRSGYLAAESVLRALGRAEQILQPDLPTARLSRWLFGI